MASSNPAGLLPSGMCDQVVGQLQERGVFLQNLRGSLVSFVGGAGHNGGKGGVGWGAIAYHS